MTATASIDNTALRADFEAFIAERYEPERIADLRHAALEQFEKQGLPTTRQEE